MRFEGQRQGGHFPPARLIERTLENRLMAAMNAVEIADRHDAATQLLRQRYRTRQAFARHFHCGNYRSFGIVATGR
jgi:hypothetical protein